MSASNFSSVAVPNVHAENGFGCGGVSLGPDSRSTPVANGYYGAVGPPRVELIVNALAEPADLPEATRNLGTVADSPRHRQPF